MRSRYLKRSRRYERIRVRRRVALRESIERCADRIIDFVEEESVLAKMLRDKRLFPSDSAGGRRST